MKVCHFTSVHSWNDIRIFLKECRSLAKAGHDVYLVAKGVEDQTVDGVHIRGVQDLGGSRIKRALFQSKLVYRRALELDCDIYHFHDPELLRYGLKLKKRGKKVIYDAHEDFPGQIKGKHWIPRFLRSSASRYADRFEKRIARQLTGIVTATPTIADIFSPVNSKTIAINNYPLPEEFPITNQDLCEREQALCYIGAISRIRGIVPIVKAMEHINGTLHLAGRIGEPGLQQEIEALPGWKKVVFHGMVGRQEVAAILGKCPIGIVTFLPNQNHLYCQPNKLFEYMIAGQAVVASNFPFWEQYLQNGQCGLMVNPEDPKAIAEAVNDLLHHPEKAQQMGLEGRKLVMEKFTWEKEQEKLIDFYKSL
jgi:glycosyltransferase involved in cell wall biosynthesis